MDRGLALLAMLVVSSQVFGSIQSLKQKLAVDNYPWVAEENPISELSMKEKRRLLGAPMPTTDHYFSVAAKPAGSNGLPSKFDWRNVDGTSFASPILNQGHCGSCVAFAAVGTLETQMNISWNTPFSPWAYSTQHLFACGDGACELGWWPQEAVAFMEDRGIPDEACFPYKSGAVGEDQSCSDTCSDADKRSLKLTGHTTPTSLLDDRDAVKEALLKGPLMTTMTVYEDFFYYKRGVYRHVDGAAAGGHAISMVGWDDAEKAWIVRNSWGSDWGEDGYFRIRWDDASRLGIMTWGMEVPGPTGYVALRGIRDKHVMKGQIEVQIDSTYQNTTKKEWTLKGAGTRVHSGLAALTGVTTIDTTTMDDGVYEMTAKATHGGTVSTSQPRWISILNGTLEGSISVEGIKDGDVLTKEKAELGYTVESTPVLPTKVEFIAKNLATGVVSKRGTPNVAKNMKFNWRVAKVENGTYEVKVVGYAGNQSIESTPIQVTIRH